MKNLIAAIVIVLVIFFYLFFTSFKPIMVIESDSYVLKDNLIAENLLSDKTDGKKAKVTPLKVGALDSVYSGQGRLFVGDIKKESINNIYPLFTNDNLAIVNLSSDSTLIDANFKEYEGYPNFTLTSGELYNKDDKTRADNNEYLFLRLSNMLLVNSKAISINTNLNEFKIPINSIITFNNDDIRYYYFNDGSFTYDDIAEMDMKSTVSIDSKQYTYKDFLTKLKILSTTNEEIPYVPIPPEEEEEVPYVKPTVKAGDFTTSVYSSLSTLSISDPAKRITSPIIFEVRKDGDLYLKKAFLSSGAFEIIGLSPSTTFEVKGSFQYLNQNGVQVEEVFVTKKITTKGTDSLPALTLSFANGEIYPTSIEITNLMITDGLGTETIRGIKKAIVKIDGESYRMSTQDLNALLTGKEITYTSPDNVSSNKVVEYEIILSDGYGNDAKVNNNKGETRTSKQVPNASVKVEKNDISEVVLRVLLDNKDKAAIQNYRYIVGTMDNKIISQGSVPNDGLIHLNSLNSSELFSVYIYADYDIEDGKGVKTNRLIGETKFTSVPITSLGYARLNLKLTEILQNEAIMEVNLDVVGTDRRLSTLLAGLKLNIIEKKDNQETVVFTKDISEQDMTSLKFGQKIEEHITDLNSASTYYIKLISTVMQGDKEYIIDTLTNIKTFTTLKREPKVLIRNSFSSSSIIDFDVKIEDLDEAILNGSTRLEVRDAAGKIVRVEKLDLNEDYVRITYDKLNSNTFYTFNYIAEEYNIAHDNSTFENNRIIKTYKVYTTEGINGKIGIVSLLDRQIGKNLFDIDNLIRWKSSGTGYDEKSIDANDNTITLTALNGYHNYSYYLIDYASRALTISFYAKVVNGTAPVYVANTDGDGTSYALTNLTSSYKKYTYTFTLNANGYIGFNIREVAGKNLRTTIMIKDLQVEVGNSATAYEAFVGTNTYEAKMNINLGDTRDEITSNEYYIKVYKVNDLANTYTYNLDETNEIIDKIVSYNLEKNTVYTLELVVRINEREYVIAMTSLTTEKEIRSISSVADFFKMHNNGRYLVNSDLSFVNNNTTFSSYFYGEIDFQGHKVTIATQNGPEELFRYIGSTGVLKNIDLRVHLNNTLERIYYYGFIYYNYGTIQNLMVTIEEATNVPNVAFTVLCATNYGIIENFVVNSKVAISGERAFSAFVYNNYGNIRNGYLYGQPLNATFTNLTTNSKKTGVVASYTSESSRIENIFSLISVNSVGESNNNQFGMLVGENNRGLIQNAYMVGDLNVNNSSGDPIVGYVPGSINTSKVFYAGDKIYNAKYSQKVSNVAIRDSDFQNTLLNGDDKFLIDGLVDNGYYPQIKMPDCMPYQELIPLVEVHDSDLVDITSTEVLESSTDSIRVLFNIHNPAAERITNISIKDASVRILSQEDSKGKTKVTAMVENPSKYLSKYYIRSITSKGAFDISYTRNYADNERALYFDLYRRINNITDWKNIKQNPSENYQLTSDLDFMYAADFLVGNFSGKLNGAGHTIKNIEVTSGNGLFTALSGEIKNLFVQNYKKTNASTYGGMIYNSVSPSIIDNVHMNNVSINGTSQIGGIIGNASGTIIKNSSVTNFKNITGEELGDVKIGGLVGYSSGSYILNSFVQNVNIDITNSISTYGVGGIVGQLDGGIVENCYATGNIKTNSSNTGGIVGYSNANISNVYTNVKIESEMDYIGGIIGRATNNYVYNSLVVGSLYSSYLTTNLHRTTGNVAHNQNNYALSTQLINGYVTDSFYGEILIDYQSLLLQDTYIAQINLGDYFDYSGVASGYLPKLYNVDRTALLPNQVNSSLPIEKFSITDVQIVKRMTDATILINFENPTNLEITGIEFDYLHIISTNKNVTQDGMTSIEVIVDPIRYLDTYNLNRILYIENGESKTYDKDVKLELQLYKDIASFNDWQQIEKKFLKIIV